MFPKEPDVSEHVGRKLTDGACPQMTRCPVLFTRHVLVQVEPVCKLELDQKVHFFIKHISAHVTNINLSITAC